MNAPSRWPLVAVWIVVLSLLGYGLWLRYHPRDLDEALTELLDGDVERKHRVARLTTVRDEALPQAREGDVRFGLLAAMAAIELLDRERFAETSQLLAGKTVYLPGGGTREDTELLREACFGEPYLRNLMLAYAAENRGERAEAHRRFQQVWHSARMFHSPLAAELAAAGAQRTE